MAMFIYNHCESAQSFSHSGQLSFDSSDDVWLILEHSTTTSPIYGGYLLAAMSGDNSGCVTYVLHL